MRDDNMEWAEALAGRPVPGSDPATLAEAGMLRDAARRWPVAVPVQEPPDVDMLVAAARAAGHLDPRRGWCRGCLARWRAFRVELFMPLGAAGLVMATLLGLSVLVPGLLQDEADVRSELRAPAGVNLRRDADPAAARDRLQARLVAMRLSPHGYVRLGRYGLDVELPRPLPSALEQLLRNEGWMIASDGSLRVEYEQATP